LLKKLYIKNYLIIKEAELEFTAGLNILTGETGAGKTIILDALGLILGERADYSVIKNDKLVIEGHFEFNKNSSVSRFLSQRELETEVTEQKKVLTVIARRELTQRGTTRAFINDTPVSINDLKEFGDLIIDIHSQNEHQSLLKKETHIDILDKFIKDDKRAVSFKKSYEIYKNIVFELEELINKKESLLEKKNFIQFQLKEINDVNPQPNEEEELENELTKMENVEEISTGLNSCIKLLYESDVNAAGELRASVKELKKISKYDSGLEKIAKILESAYVSVKEAAEELRDYANDLNFDPLRIEQIRDRLGALSFLKKKYRLTVSELINKSFDLAKELDFTENFDFETEKIQKNAEESKAKLIETARILSAERKTAVKEIEKKVNAYLKEVGLESAQFKAGIRNYEKEETGYFIYKSGTKNIYISGDGTDDVEFLIVTNKGGEYAPLRKAASGGEISRIMLAIKASLSEKDNVPVLVFDEIDAGISGRIAGKVGKLLKELASTHQIISITHLPQIAAMSNNHFYVSKKDAGNETVAEIKKLSEEEKISEVARLLSSEKVTASSLKTAKELISD
jgi:DNA repair protein RecN (Recombination protein N)